MSLSERLSRVGDDLAIIWPGGRMGPVDAEVTLRLPHRSLLLALAQGDIGVLGEAYVRGEVLIDGRLRTLMRAAAALVDNPTAAVPGSAWAAWWQRHRSRTLHQLGRDAQHIQFHYDVSDDFYALWLDPRRVYSCAYWPTGVDDLAAAQEAKLDLICRKLRLQPGQHFLDVGAGWGGLLFWAAQHYGVRATGITLSRNQHAHVTQQIAALGLAGQVHIELVDYRELSAPRRSDSPYGFDRIASVGMFEHVGRAQLSAYFGHLHDLLAPGGLLLNHGITAGGLHNRQLGAGLGDFVERHIFPGGELVHVAHVATDLAASGLELLDLENLRPHYARTLWAWSDALEAHLDAAAALVRSDTLRAYRLYLAGSAMGFEQGWMSLNQLLAARPDGHIDATATRRLRGAQSDHPFERSVPPCSTSSSPKPPAT